MHQDPSSSTGLQEPDETEEPVLVEAQEFSDDDENFAHVEAEDDHFDFEYDEDDEEEEEKREQNDFEDDFEDDDDEMSLVRFGLHDLNTLRHLYRFGLLQTQNCTSCLQDSTLMMCSTHLR